MSATPFRGLTTLAALSVCLILAGRAAADAPDLLKQFQRQNQVEVQKAESDVNRALAEARRLELSNPETAIKLLQSARSRLNDVRGLSDERRTELKGLLDARLRSVQAALRRQQADADQKAAQAAARDRERERQRLAQGQNPSDQAKSFINKGREQLGTAAGIKDRKEKGFLGVQDELARASIPEVGDYKIPKYWRELSERRKKYTMPQLTEQEKNLLRALNSTLSVEFNKTALRDVINYLQEKTGTSIIVDKEALREAQVEYDDPVEFTAQKVTFRTILRKVLADRGLAYILNKGIIEVVTPQKARETLVTRTYPIQELLPLNPRLPLFVQQAQMMEAAHGIMQQIQAGTDPSIWKENGGNATISFNPGTMSLIIRAPAEMHYSMSNLFTR
jgi:hypothetical protein